MYFSQHLFLKFDMQAVLWLLNTNSVLFSAGGIFINFIRQNTFSAKASLFIRLSKNPLNISLNCFFIIIHIHAHTNYQQLYSSIVLSFLSWRTSSFVIIQLQFSTVFSIPILLALQHESHSCVSLGKILFSRGFFVH